YKGGAQALSDVLAGQITMLFSTPLLAEPHVRGGKLRMLAVTTRTRAKALPEIPTMIEAGVPGYEINTWNALLAVSGTPVPIIRTLHAATLGALAAIKDRLARDGSEAVGGTPEELSALIRNDIAKWKKLVTRIGIQESG
ncbi:MAG TPA: tripartite tricarboxylate transporter substrate-binding protein, partial [Burkholderiales bacterium]|nr:tripartite tricarboxylate transporter substrate-binding protein [Burkholderiales bacterium]